MTNIEKDMAEKIQSLSEEDKVDFYERAGMREFYGGFPEFEAKLLAWNDMIKRKICAEVEG